MPITYDENELPPDQRPEPAPDLIRGQAQDTDNTVPPSPEPFNPEASLAQLLDLMQRYSAAGLIHQRQDGSFVLPGQRNQIWDLRVQVGSTCTCPQCTEHNQRHWLCMICGSSHEWVMVQDRPRVMRTNLGSGGVAGFSHLVCSNECGLEYRRRMGMGGEVVSTMGQERAIPVAGGIEDPSFFLPS